METKTIPLYKMNITKLNQALKEELNKPTDLQDNLRIIKINGYLKKLREKNNKYNRVNTPEGVNVIPTPSHISKYLIDTPSPSASTEVKDTTNESNKMLRETNLKTAVKMLRQYYGQKYGQRKKEETKQPPQQQQPEPIAIETPEPHIDIDAIYKHLTPALKTFFQLIRQQATNKTI